MEKGLWQAEAELSRFDDDAIRLKQQQGAYASDLQAAKAQNVVQSHVDAYYNPQDPRADWSGLVANQGTKKFIPGAQGARCHVERTEEGGIVAAEDYHEVLPGGKKHWDDDGRFATQSQRQFPGNGVEHHERAEPNLSSDVRNCTPLDKFTGYLPGGLPNGRPLGK